MCRALSDYLQDKKSRQFFHQFHSCVRLCEQFATSQSDGAIIQGIPHDDTWKGAEHWALMRVIFLTMPLNGK